MFKSNCTLLAFLFKCWLNYVLWRFSQSSQHNGIEIKCQDYNADTAIMWLNIIKGVTKMAIQVLLRFWYSCLVMLCRLRLAWERDSGLVECAWVSPARSPVRTRRRHLANVRPAASGPSESDSCIQCEYFINDQLHWYWCPLNQWLWNSNVSSVLCCCANDKSNVPGSTGRL